MMKREVYKFTTLWNTSTGFDKSEEASESQTEALRIVIDDSLTKSDLKTLSEMAAAFDRVRLVFKSHHKEAWEGLADFESLVGIQVGELTATEVDLIPSSVTELCISLGKLGDALIDDLGKFKALKKLNVAGDFSSISVFEGFPMLESLFVSYSKKLELASSSVFSQLRSLRLQHGSLSSAPNIDSFPVLKNFQTWRCRNLDSVDWLAGSPELRSLILGAQPQMTSLPVMSHFEFLEYIMLEQMKGLSSISELAKAPRVKQIQISEMNHIPIENYQAFVNHKNLRELSSGYSSRKKQNTVNEIVGLPPVKGQPFYDIKEF